MTALRGSYINVAEADALVEDRLVSTDERRTAWEAASDADKAVLLRAACRAIDACHWLGKPEDPRQGLAWPRIHKDGTAVEGAEGVTPAVVGDITAWSVAGLPGELLVATAIQAARLALAALGLDDGASIEADAQRGVTGRSGAAGSYSIDPARAGSPRARLDADASAAMRGLFAWGGSLA